MASKIKLKNDINSEFTVQHNDGSQAITVSSEELSKVIPIDTIALLRAKTVTPSTVWVSGYYTKGDGAFGSNIFEWDSTSTEDDNGGTIIKLTNVATGRYKLKFNGVIMPEMFGAGQGESDDTSFQNMFTFMTTNSINYMSANPKSVFNISTGLNLSFSDVCLDFMGATVQTTEDIIIFNVGAENGSSNSYVNIDIKNLKGIGGGSTKINNRCIVLRNASYCNLENIVMKNFGNKPLYIYSEKRGVQYNSFTNIEITENYNGAMEIDINTEDSGSYVTDNTFNNIRMHDTPRTSTNSITIAQLNNTSGNRFIGCGFESRDDKHTLLSLISAGANHFLSIRLDGINNCIARSVDSSSRGNIFLILGREGLELDDSKTSIILSDKGTLDFPYLGLGSYNVSIESPGSSGTELTLQGTDTYKGLRIPLLTNFFIGNRNGGDNSPFMFTNGTTPVFDIFKGGSVTDTNSPYLRFWDGVSGLKYNIKHTSKGLAIGHNDYGSDGQIRFNSNGSLTMQYNSYSRPIYFGTYAIWVDTNGDLRKYNGTPPTDTSGVIIG